MVMLETNARLVVTDSGGVQKESYFYRVPCISGRDETERIEPVYLGWNRVRPPAEYANPHRVLERAFARARDAIVETDRPYGQSKAGENIVAEMREFQPSSTPPSPGRTGKVATK